VCDTFSRQGWTPNRLKYTVVLRIAQPVKIVVAEPARIIVAEQMMEIAEYLRSLGITPLSALMIALSVWATSQYFKYKIEREKEKDKQALEFLAERMKKRSALLEELNGHVHNFDHYVNHVHEGDRCNGLQLKPVGLAFNAVLGSN
jgi:hypothetical protein